MFVSPPRRAVPVALVAVLVAGLAACSSEEEPTGSGSQGLSVTPPPVTDVPTVDSVRNLRLPSEAYKPTAAEQNLVGDATEKLITDCMRQFGFAWTTRPNQMKEVNQTDRVYGVADLETAQRYGYRLPPTDGRSSGADKKTKRSQGTSYSPSTLLVLTGSSTGEEKTSGAEDPGSYRGKEIPAGGCAGQARRQVTGVDEIDPTRAADSIVVSMWEKSKSDPRVVAVIKKWAACMKESGYNYPSPLEVGDPKWSSSGRPSENEIQTAVADVKCKQRTNLIGVWFSVESGYEKQAIQQNIEQLTQIKKRWTEAARKAAQILGRPAPRQS